MLDDSAVGFYYHLEKPAGSIKVKIFTMAYRKIYEDSSLSAEPGSHFHTLDRAKLNSFANGLYFVAVYLNDGGTESRQILKLLIRR